MRDIQYTPLVVPMNVDEAETTLPLGVDAPYQPRFNGDYEKLRNRPSINGVELIGDKTSAELGIDRTYIYEHPAVSDTWTITHNLDKYPSVTVVDSAGTVVIGDVQYTDENTLVVTFAAAFSGTAYLN